MKNYEFKKIISKWSDALHQRNIDICLSVACGSTYGEVADDFGLSKNRIMQIYRIGMALLCNQLFCVDYIAAVYDKTWYKHPDALRIIEAYNKFYNSL